MSRKLWKSPNLPSLRGTDSGEHSVNYRSLTEYFRQHIGYWDDVSGTTNATGDITFTVDCGFKPVAVLVTEIYAGAGAHDMGPFNVEEFSATSLKIHFLTKSGQDRATHDVRVCYLMLPDATER
jgi:hypothetical protein